MLSSDDEDIKEEEREKFVNTLKWTKPLPGTIREIDTLLICTPGTPEALTRILYYGRMREVAEPETQYHSGNRTHKTLKIYRGDSIQQENEGKAVLIVHTTEALRVPLANDLCKKLFESLSKQNLQVRRILILDSVYKTNYSTIETGHYEPDVNLKYPLKYHASSFMEKEVTLQGFMAKHQSEFKPAGVLNIVSGYPAAVLIHAEFNGMPCLMLSAISDSHYVTDETLTSFETVAQEILGFEKVKFDQISSMPGFKTALKEANARDNTIFT